MTEYEKQMNAVRKEIDEIDSELIPILVKRFSLSARVAETKRTFHMPVFDMAREKTILEKVKERTGENGDFVSAVYASIFSSSRAKQNLMLASGQSIRDMGKNAPAIVPKSNVKVLCQGVQGAYAHQAARLFFNNDCIHFSSTWENLFTAVEERSVDFAVVPVENSAAGSVNDVYSLIMKYRLYIVGAAEIKIKHCLAAKTAESTIKRVISHPQALSQCSNYIDKNSLQAESFSNTATAAKFVAEQKDSALAAICSKEAAEKYGLTILQEEIQNTEHNATRFIVISHEPYLPKGAKKISLCFSLPHTPGSLSTILSQFSMQGLNLTKIESRPIPEKKFEYDFYLDFTANFHDLNTQNLICALSDELPRFSFLGNYEEIQG
ncbi:prephenate dehydratase [Scatolibacter rhodanostii]|uniref:prephenate dehydratase n=1 Tax=Scatolibacter rhodanostii TaxID=2014781 RepID=UPI001FA83997|nr:prephenate dehydratase [Scatolibacter rhodanostii]